MNKPQAQILFLILIAVAFIGQAIHDYIKKNRARSRRHPAPLVRSAVRHVSDLRPETIKRHTTDKGTAMTDTTPTVEETMESIEPAVSAGNRPKTSRANDELRRAVIWSEILKRKF